MLVSLLELAVNNALRFDESASQRLAKLQGKTVTLEIKPAAICVSINISQDGLEFSGNTGSTNDASETKQKAQVSDVTLRATVGALVKIGRDGMDNAQLEPGELEINGDPIVGQRFAGILSDLDIDWQSLLAEHIGETPAVAVSGGFGKAKEFASASKSLMSEHIKDVLMHDMQLVADKAMVEPLLDDVDNLRADVDRLQARLNRLLQTQT